MALKSVMTNSPAVSVIIPLYNAENYIAECLESIFMQTFQNYEVIVVDDCSTDKSCAVVESYLEKFGGRLKIIRTEKNSGSGALPKNKGIYLSRGEYIFFVDDDDLIMESALEELYTLAKNFDADVVHCEKNYRLSANTIGTLQSSENIVEPRMETENFKERLHKILQNDNYRVQQWTKLVRRDLILEHELFFPETSHSDDTIWTYGLVFYAKRFLRVPNIVYCQRLTKDSIMRKSRSPLQEINFWLNPLINGLKILDDLMGKFEFFKQNPKYRCALLENFVHMVIVGTLEPSFQNPLPTIYDSIKKEFGNKFGEHDVLISFLLTDLIAQQKIFAEMQERIAELEKNK